MVSDYATLKLLEKDQTIAILCTTEKGCQRSFLGVKRFITEDLPFLFKNCSILTNKREIKNNDTGSVLDVINIKAKSETQQSISPNFMIFDEQKTKKEDKNE